MHIKARRLRGHLAGAMAGAGETAATGNLTELNAGTVAADTGHHARPGTRLLAKLYRGGHPRPPNFMRFPRRNTHGSRQSNSNVRFSGFSSAAPTGADAQDGGADGPEVTQNELSQATPKSLFQLLQ